MHRSLCFATLVLATAWRGAAAQETPTERSAAADVVRRMNALERALALPPLVARLTGGRDPRRDAVLASPATPRRAIRKSARRRSSPTISRRTTST